jgi:cytochrome c oxidase cbb3-type subunit III
MLVLTAALPFVPVRLKAQQAAAPQPGPSPAREGQRIFQTSCAACHGLDARGGERGPDIATRREIQQLPDEALLRIVQDGVAGTSMPSFRSLGSAEIEAVVAQLRSLQNQGAQGALPGDPERGKALFFGKPGCSACHMAKGEGGFLASDLSGDSIARSAEDIRSAITEPNRNLDPRKRPVTVITRSGKQITGVARNEDNFSLQLQGLDGTFYLFAKRELRSLAYQDRSLMPADYQTRLSGQELDDLVSYVMTVAPAVGRRPAAKE